MKFYDAHGPNPHTPRLFALERRAEIEVVPIDVYGHENRRPPYCSEINTRGEVPALVTDDGAVITEITAICEYMDEVSDGPSLIGETPEQRGVTRMWTRRVYLGICHPAIEWGRCKPESEDFYFGHRVFTPQSIHGYRAIAEQGLNWLETQLRGEFLAGDRYSMADTILFAFMNDAVNGGYVPWFNNAGRPNIAAWYGRIAERPASKRAQAPLPAGRLSH